METTAHAAEVLGTLTAFMRGEIEGISPRERLRAAELLGKRLGLFNGGEDGGDGPVIIVEGELER
jgi:hypothetical protein